MRRQHRLDQHVCEHRLEFFEAHAIVPQALEDRLQAFGLRLAAGRPGSLAPDAVDLLGKIHHAEPGGEPAHAIQRPVRLFETAPGLQHNASDRAVAPVYGRGTGAFDTHEESFSALLSQQVAVRTAELADIVARWT